MPVAEQEAAWDRRLRRANTPVWLDTFCRQLFGAACIRCGIDRPLEVAHIDDWRSVRDALVAGQAEHAEAFGFTFKDAKWIFHQPANVVLLCCNCHTLYDHPQYADVDREQIIVAREAALDSERAALVVREYVCRGWTGGIGSFGNANVINRWWPLLRWMHHARGLLPHPHPHSHPHPHPHPHPHQYLISDTEMSPSFLPGVHDHPRISDRIHCRQTRAAHSHASSRLRPEVDLRVLGW